VAILGHGLLRIAASADGVLVGLYLAMLGRQHSRIGAGLAGALGAAAYAAELAASIPLGAAADAISVRVLMALGALTSAIGTRLFVLAPTPIVFFPSRLLQGFGLAAVTPPLLKFLVQATTHAPVRRARVMSFFEVSMLAGFALGGLLAGQLWTYLGVRAFTAVAILAALCAVLLFAGSREVAEMRPSTTVSAWREMLGNPFVRRLAPVWIGVNAVVGLWLGPTLTFLLTARSTGDQYLVGLFAATPADVGWLLLCYAAIFTTGVSLWSILLPKISTPLALRISLSAMLAVCGVLFLLNHCFSCSPDERWMIEAGAALLVMIESGFTPAALAWLAQSLESAAGKGATMGVYSVLFGLGALGGSLLAGALGALWRIDGLLFGTVLVATVALAFLILRPPRQVEAPR
jgi:MFS family permease